jgi:chemotaxis protein methyltransferase CheR
VSVRTTETVRRVLRERAGIVLEPGKEYLIESRLAPLAQSVGAASVDALVADGRSTDRVVEAMTINETSFFRDRHPFDALRDTLLPEVLARRTGTVRIWSAACSTGQEAYSIAMLVQEHFPADARRVSIIGTDLAPRVLEQARAGRFGQLEVNRGLPAPLLVRWFERDGRDWMLKEQIRRMVRFEQHNLVRDAPLAGCDIVLLRNVLIYFDTDTRTEVLGRVRDAMAPDGALILGAAETMYGLSDDFERAWSGSAMFHRVRPAIRLGAR